MVLALLEKNLVGGNTFHTQALVYRNKQVTLFGHNILRFGRVTHSIRDLHIY